MRVKSKVPVSRLCVAALSALLVTGNAVAFKPAQEYGHIGITKQAANDVSHVTASGETLRFSWRSIDQLRQANASTDGTAGGGEFWDPRAHCDDELLATCSGRILTLKNQAIAELRAGPGNGRKARATIGRALHTLQDFYAHTNWVNSPGPSHTSFNPILGRGVQTSLGLNQQTCISSDDEHTTLTGAGLTQVTSGYFNLSALYNPPIGKCLHGLPLGVSGSGINKDSPGRDHFEAAQGAAIAATKDFLGQIIEALGTDEDAIRMLMDIRPSIGFVIDDSGSMGRSISGVIGSVSQLALEAVADPLNTPDRIVLQTFNDPTIGTPTVYPSYNNLMAGLNAIRPNGGGDCPELAMTGVMSALNAVSGGSSLFVYTDASTKDRHLSQSVSALASQRKVVINYIVSGSCSPIDPSYFDTASRTGGALFLAYNTEMATPFLRALSSKDNRLVFSSFDTLTDDLRSYRIDVDSAARNLLVAIGTDNVRNIKLFDPDGLDVTADTSVAKVVNFYSGASLSVATPKAGEWTVEFVGNGQSFANAYVASPISIIELGAVQESGRLGHEGLFPINGAPVLGDAGLIQATIEGAPADQLEVRRLTGELVNVHPFTAEEIEDLGGGVHKYTVPVVFDETPVRFFLRGNDANGVGFMRAFPTSYAAQPLRVSIQDAAFKLLPGQTRTVNFVVENRGSEADIKFLATASPEVINASFVAPTVHLATGAQAVIGVPVSIPADSELEDITLVASASDTALPAHANSSIVQLMVGALDSDSDGVVDDEDQCLASNLEETVRLDSCDSGTTNHVFEDGCSISDEVEALRSEAGNHGVFVSSTSHYTHDLADLGVITNKEASSIVNCAAKTKTP